jgi:hypothetical protein
VWSHRFFPVIPRIQNLFARPIAQESSLLCGGELFQHNPIIKANDGTSRENANQIRLFEPNRLCFKPTFSTKFTPNGRPATKAGWRSSGVEPNL